MSKSESDNVLIKALPPETDYLSYLTIVEYNLDKDQLPTLHQILQDTKLTTNIGWDLVHLLLPLLPESKTCLQDVARLGNPREVVLKITELLEGLGSPDKEEYGAEEDPSDDGADGAENGAENGEDGPLVRNGTIASRSPTQLTQFCVLVEMLQVLLPRIRTKYPSRFLTTAVQALLPAYAQVAAESEATEAVVTFIKNLSGSRRPKLPPRVSSTNVISAQEESPSYAPDPEGNDGTVDLDEQTLQKRLLQALLTFVVEGWMTSLPQAEDVPGLAWCSRVREHDSPNRKIAGRRTFTEVFDSGQGYLHNRDAVIGQFTAIARDLSLLPSELLDNLIKFSPPSSPTDARSNTDEVPLSSPGALYLLVASFVASHLFDAPHTLPSSYISPHYTTIINELIGSSVATTTGTEPLALIDAVLALANFIILDSPPGPVDTFKDTLQRLALLSANTPNASLRYEAHLVTARILHSHPDENVRKTYIKDTLQNCPYENLKASAVGWLKDEIIDAEGGLFASPQALIDVQGCLFIDLKSLPAEDAYGNEESVQVAFLAHQGFFLAILNLMYFHLSSRRLEMLNYQLSTDFMAWMRSLRDMIQEIRDVAKAGGELIEGLVIDLNLLEGNMDMVQETLLEVKQRSSNQAGK